VGCGDNLSAPDAATGKDGGMDANNSKFTILASFDPAMMQNPEGVLVISNTVYAGIAALGQVVQITTPGSFRSFGNLPAPVSNTFTRGLAAEAAGNVYVGVGASGATPMPAPGIYKIPAAGGTATLFSSSNMMNFPNALDIDGTKMYVTDSAAGRILE